LALDRADGHHSAERNVSAVIPLSDERAGTRLPVVTIAIIVACVVVYLFVQPTPGRETSSDAAFDFRHAAIPYELTHGRPLTNCQVARTTGEAPGPVCAGPAADDAFAPGKAIYLAVITALFLHGGILHIAGNLLFLWVFGRRVEDRLGPALYAGFYLAAGIAAAACQVLASVDSTVPFIGASGAIAGVMGAYLVWFPHARINTLFFVFVIIWFKIQAQWVLLAWFVLQFFTSPNSDVAWVAHVGGFVFGMAVALLWRLLRPHRPAPAI
jgi:membrane associated rhomboid family serine protease